MGHCALQHQVFRAGLQVSRRFPRRFSVVLLLFISCERSRAEFSKGRLPTAMLMDVDAYRCCSLFDLLMFWPLTAAFSGLIPNACSPFSTLSLVRFPSLSPCSALRESHASMRNAMGEQSCASST